MVVSPCQLALFLKISQCLSRTSPNALSHSLSSFSGEKAKFTQSLLRAPFTRFMGACKHSHEHSLLTAIGSSGCSSVHVSVGDYQHKRQSLKTNRQTDLRTGANEIMMQGFIPTTNHMTVDNSQGKTKGQQLKGKIVSEFFTLFALFHTLGQKFPYAEVEVDHEVELRVVLVAELLLGTMSSHGHACHLSPSSFLSVPSWVSQLHR